MRGFASLLFAAALAAHLGPAGAPLPEGTPVCVDEVGAGAHTGGYVLDPATPLLASQAEATSDARERTGGPDPRRALPRSATDAPRVTWRGAARFTGAHTPASLLGFAGHPTTAPPLQA